MVKLNNFYDIKFQALQKFQNSTLSKKFTGVEFDVFIKNPVFVLLASRKIFDLEFPHPIDQCGIFKELEFYNIRENDVIAYIGAGQGIFSLMVDFMQNNNKIYINEIDEHLLEYNRQNILPLAKNPQNIHVIKGDKKSLNLLVKVAYLNLSKYVRPKLKKFLKDEPKEIQDIYATSQEKKYREEMRPLIKESLIKQGLQLRFNEIIHHVSDQNLKES